MNNTYHHPTPRRRAARRIERALAKIHAASHDAKRDMPRFAHTNGDAVAHSRRRDVRCLRRRRDAAPALTREFRRCSHRGDAQRHTRDQTRRTAAILTPPLPAVYEYRHCSAQVQRRVPHRPCKLWTAQRSLVQVPCETTAKRRRLRVADRARFPRAVWPSASKSESCWFR